MANRSSGTDPLRRRWSRKDSLLGGFACLAVAQLELLDPPIDSAQDGKQMKLLLD